MTLGRIVEAFNIVKTIRTASHSAHVTNQPVTIEKTLILIAGKLAAELTFRRFPAGS